MWNLSVSSSGSGSWHLDWVTSSSSALAAPTSRILFTVIISPLSHNIMRSFHRRCNQPHECCKLAAVSIFQLLSEAKVMKLITQAKSIGRSSVKHNQTSHLLLLLSHASFRYCIHCIYPVPARGLFYTLKYDLCATLSLATSIVRA